MNNRTVTATALRQELRNLLATLDEGPVAITKHGKIVAHLVASSSEATEEATETEQASTVLAKPELTVVLGTDGELSLSESEEIIDLDHPDGAGPIDLYEVDEDADFEQYLAQVGN